MIFSLIKTTTTTILRRKKNKKTHNVDAEGKKLGTDTIGCDQLTRLTGNLNFKKGEKKENNTKLISAFNRK